MFVLLTLLLYFLSEQDIISEDVFEMIFPITATVSLVMLFIVLYVFVGNINKQRNVESKRSQIIRLMDERYDPKYSEYIRDAFDFNRERKNDSAFAEKWWTVGLRKDYHVDSIPIPMLIGTRRSELDVNLR